MTELELHIVIAGKDMRLMGVSTGLKMVIIGVSVYFFHICWIENEAKTTAITNAVAQNNL